MKKFSPAEADAFFAALAAKIPHPKGELESVNPYTLLVAVVLSAQATDAGVNKATKELFRLVDSPEKMLSLGEARLKSHIKTIGLFNTKAKNVIALSRMLMTEHGGQVPRDRESLQTLPGVGRKTANVVLNVAFGEPTPARPLRVQGATPRLPPLRRRVALPLQRENRGAGMNRKCRWQLSRCLPAAAR